MSGPYRAGSSGGTQCTTCGAELVADARLCAQCGTERPAVRCASCMTLNPIGSDLCASCGKALGLEPEPEPTQLLCPRGCGPLAALGAQESEQRIAECERCGGIFVENQTLAKLVADHRPPPGAQGPAHAAPSIRRPELPPETEVTYRPCPSCNVRMNRTIFGRSSGVVVDVCKLHGTWFDARELTASLAFVEMGGIELVERREKLRQEEERRRAEVERRIGGFEALNSPVSPTIQRIFEGGPRPDRLEAVRDILQILLGL